MKSTLLLITSLICAGTALAGFEIWTSKDGRAAELELVKVTETDGEKSGEFRLRNGRSVTLKASELDEASAARLDEPVSEENAAAPAGAESVFDKILDGNLVKLDGRSVRRYKPETKPEKLYLFYYTASWCGPCQRYTPELVSFYNKQKPGNTNFEIVLISSDRDDSAATDYMKEKKMPWPALNVKDSAKFKKEFQHGVKGIPSVVICKTDGTVVAKARSIPELEKLVTAE